MRSSIAAVAASLFFAASAHAVPITWDLNAVVTRTNLPALGDISIGDAITATMVVETDTPVTHPTTFSSGLYNVFDSFTLTVGGRTLTLGPQATDPLWIRETNWMGAGIFEPTLYVQAQTLLFDGSDPYVASLWFEYSDFTAYPIDHFPASPPSLATATLRELWIHSPINGDPRNGAISIAGAQITSFTARSVPEPSTLTLMLGGLALVWVARRQRAFARQD